MGCFQVDVFFVVVVCLFFNYYYFLIVVDLMQTSTVTLENSVEIS